jgi:hypothetical protein
MSKRLQVLLEEDDFREVREAAARDGITVSEWVRRALRDARRGESRRDLDDEVRAIRTAARCNFPTADIDEMLEQIARAYSAESAGR